MASVTLTTGPRQKLQVSMTPAKTLAQALAEFCSKFDLDLSDHTLTHNKKNLDLALSWRLAGISANATLEVKPAAASSKSGEEAAAQVQIALTLESGRHIMSFPNNTSVWNILKKAETEKGLSLITASFTKKLKNGEIQTLYNQPIVNFMSTDLSTNTELRKTTLSALGVKSGSAVLRVRFKPTEIPLKEFLAADAILAEEENGVAKATEQRISDAKVATQLRRQEESLKRAQEEEIQRQSDELRQAEVRQELAERQAREIAQFERDVEDAKRASMSETSSTMDVDQPRKNKFEVVVEPPGPPLPSSLLRTLAEGGMIDQDYSRIHDMLRVQADEVEKANVIPSEPCARALKVFAPSSTPFDPSSIELPDDFFEVSPEDLAKSKTTNRNQTSSNAGEVKTKAMKEKERLQRLSKFKKCYVRFRFPDRVELQGTFYPQEGLKHLLEFVRSTLNDPSLDFYLFTTPPTTHVHKTKNLRDQGFLPAALVQVGLAPGVKATSPFLKPDVMTHIQEKTYVPIMREFQHASDMTIVTGTTITRDASSSSSSPSSSAHMEIDKPSTKEKASKTSDKANDKKKVPKWFAAGLKKK